MARICSAEDLKAATQTLKTMLLGSPCLDVEKTGHLWQLRFNDGATLNLECPWRLLLNGSIVFGDTDDGQAFGFPQAINGVETVKNWLGTALVKALSIQKGSGDLFLAFQNEVCLEAFNGSSGYEGWTCSGKTGATVVAQGGGNVVVWEQPA